MRATLTDYAAVAPGRNYVVEAATRLSGPYRPVAVLAAADVTTPVASITVTNSGTQTYYRVEVNEAEKEE